MPTLISLIALAKMGQNYHFPFVIFGIILCIHISTIATTNMAQEINSALAFKSTIPSEQLPQPDGETPAAYGGVVNQFSESLVDAERMIDSFEIAR